MPTYDYECPKCEACFERVLPLAQYQDPQVCEACGTVAKKVLSAPGLIFKGDDWASKNNRIAGQMAEKNRKVSQKQEERKRDAPGVRLVPNVGGERTESWSDAAKLAASQGKNTASYGEKIQAEKVSKR